MYFPSRLYDNLALTQNDPNYQARLRQVGSPELVRAWIEGDCSVIAGAFFPEFSLTKHVVAPRDLPPHWTRL